MPADALTAQLAGARQPLVTEDSTWAKILSAAGGKA